MQEKVYNLKPGHVYSSWNIKFVFGLYWVSPLKQYIKLMDIVFIGFLCSLSIFVIL